jgi:hypothetical protein
MCIYTRLKPLIVDTVYYLSQALKTGKRVMVEGTDCAVYTRRGGDGDRRTHRAFAQVPTRPCWTSTSVLTPT